MTSKPKPLQARRGTWLIIALVVGAWLPALAEGQTAGDRAGVFASGNVRDAYLPCFSLSCDAAFGDPGPQSQSALGSHGPAIVGSLLVLGSGRSSDDARASTTGLQAVGAALSGAGDDLDRRLGRRPGIHRQEPGRQVADWRASRCSTMPARPIFSISAWTATA